MLSFDCIRRPKTIIQAFTRPNASASPKCDPPGLPPSPTTLAMHLSRTGGLPRLLLPLTPRSLPTSSLTSSCPPRSFIFPGPVLFTSAVAPCPKLLILATLASREPRTPQYIIHGISRRYIPCLSYSRSPLPLRHISAPLFFTLVSFVPSGRCTVHTFRLGNFTLHLSSLSKYCILTSLLVFSDLWILRPSDGRITCKYGFWWKLQMITDVIFVFFSPPTRLAIVVCLQVPDSTLVYLTKRTLPRRFVTLLKLSITSFSPSRPSKGESFCSTSL